MPELPEVETMVRGLRPALVGAVVREIEILDLFLLRETDSDRIRAAFSGRPVQEVRRRGKWVLIESGSGAVLVIEPRMTGGFRLVPAQRPDHVRIILRIDRAPYEISFCDTRRLARVRLFDDTTVAESVISKSLAEDALAISHEYLAQRLKRTARPIKAALMDQKIVAGIGNIYADEILFESRIHPERVASSLKPAETRAIHQSISKVLAIAIEAEGSSFDVDYRTVMGEKGGFLAINAMYGHGGEPCPACSTPVRKVKIVGLANRPTHYCPTCQKAPRRRKPAGGG